MNSHELTQDEWEYILDMRKQKEYNKAFNDGIHVAIRKTLEWSDQAGGVNNGFYNLAAVLAVLTR